MARCLIIGCGCRGSHLARELAGQGHAVRGTTRDPAQRSVIEAAGAQAVVADPGRVGTIIDALDHVTVVLILLGSARGPAPALAELHGARLQALLTRMIDTTIKGVVYEARGSVEPAVLASGVASLRGFAQRARARTALLEADPAAPEPWLREALAAVETVLTPQ